MRYGKGFNLGQQVMLTPYFELGHHSWDRSINAGETYANRYYAVGALAQYSPIRKLTLTADGMVGNTYGANIDVTDAFSGSQSNSSIYRIGANVDYAFTQRFHANLGIDYTSFKLGSTATFQVGNYLLWEPASTTDYTTAKIGVGYAF